MHKTHVVTLSDAERDDLERLTRRGVTSPRRTLRARALLLADWGKPDTVIAEALGLSVRTIERLRQRAVAEGALAALDDRPRPGGTPKLDDHQLARLVAEACSDPPAGRSHWTMQLLADRLVALKVVDAISDETVRRGLKTRPSSPGSTSPGASRPSPVSSSGAWKPSSTCTPPHPIRSVR
jgi:transposase